MKDAPRQTRVLVLKANAQISVNKLGMKEHCFIGFSFKLSPDFKLETKSTVLLNATTAKG